MSAGPLLPVAHRSSTPPEGTMSFAAGTMSFAAGNPDANHGSADGWPQLVKQEDDSSPSPESDKARMLHHRPPPKFSSAAARKRAAAMSPISASSKTSSSKGSESPSTAMIPRRAEDWEPFKDIIRDLYLTQNVILNDVMIIMDRKHNLKAT